MNTAPAGHRIARCACGECELALAGDPIMTVVCYCRSCQEAGRRLAALPGAVPVVGPDGGTGYVMQRKDRVTCAKGADRLREHRLKPDSPTRRVVAACCNSPMFAEFSSGHWLSIHRDRLAERDRPPVEMRTMTMHRPAGVAFADAIPSPHKHSVGFMWRLFAAWAAMGFRAPKVDYVKGTLDA